MILFSDRLNLIKCAQERFMDAFKASDIERMVREGETVAAWSANLAEDWAIYTRMSQPF